MQDTLKAESKSPSLILQHIQELAQQLYLNVSYKILSFGYKKNFLIIFKYINAA